MLVCVSFSHFAHGTAGAARIRHSPRPLISRRETFRQTSGGPRRENADSCPSTSLRGALATKQSILPRRGEMDCVASLAMTDELTDLRQGLPSLRHRHLFSRRLCRLQSKLRLDRVAHHELLDLSGDRHRKFVDELDIARDLVVRDLAVTEAANLVGGQRLAGSRPDPCAELLAVTIVGDAEDLNIQDLGMAKEK